MRRQCLGAFFSPCRFRSTGYCQRSLRTNEYNNCCHETSNGRHISSLQEPFLSPELRWPRAPARCGVPSGPTHPSGSFTAGTGSLCHKPQSSMGKVNYWCWVTNEQIIRLYPSRKCPRTERWWRGPKTGVTLGKTQWSWNSGGWWLTANDLLIKCPANT